MTPENKIKRAILLRAKKNNDIEITSSLETDESVVEHYGELVESDCHWDYESEYRPGEVETDIECERSRHYEARSVAAKMDDGTWVGWTYWYGGGKHGEPNAIEWMEYAYDLECVETQEMVTIRKFTKPE